MVTSSRQFRLIFASGMAILLARCSPTERGHDGDCIDRGPPALLFQTAADCGVALNVDAKPVDATGYCSFHAFYGGDPSLQYATVNLSFFDGVVDRSLSVEVALARELLAGHEGQNVSSTRSGTVAVRTAERRLCDATPVLTVEADIVRAVGEIDFETREVDRNFSRTISVKVDWSAPGCGIDPFRTSQEFTIDTQRLQFGCDGLYRYRDSGAGP